MTYTELHRTAGGAKGQADFGTNWGLDNNTLKFNNGNRLIAKAEFEAGRLREE
jgi:hypothetical protein